MTVLAYADDITIILRSPQEVQAIQEAIRTYEAASGAVLNIQKSKAMALGASSTAIPVMGIEYHNELRTLGIHFATTIRASALASWAQVTRNIRTQAQEAYHRDRRLYKQIQYVSTHLLAKAWYTAQILPPPVDSTRQMNTAVSWYIWQGTTFR
jgi:hypothetical protein